MPSLDFIRMGLQNQIPSSSNEGVDAGQVIEKLTGFGHSPQEMQALASAAATPIAGGHSAQMPPSLMYQPKEWQDTPMDRREVVGAGNARARGIGNAITGLLNTVGRYETNHENKKKLQIATDTQTLLTSQAAIDQANQILKNDPKNAEAKAAIEHNQKIMDGILSDDKTRKEIAKGFHIDFTNPQANNTIPHQGVAQGREMAKKSYSQQFAEKTPQVMQPNTIALAKYQQALEEQKMNQSMAGHILQYLGAAERAKATVTAQELRNQAEMSKERFQAQKMGELLDKKQEMMEKMESIKHKNKLSEAFQRAKFARESAIDIFEYKTTSVQGLNAAYQKTNKEYTDTLEKWNQQLRQLEDDAQKNADQISKDPNAQKDYSDQLQYVRDQITQTTKEIVNVKNQYKYDMKKLHGVDIDNGTSDGKPISGSANPINSADFYSDPDFAKTFQNIINDNEEGSLF